MTLKLDDKKAIVAEVADVANQALSVVAADYRGLTSAEMTDLRAKARETGVHLKIVRNTLARLAFTGTPYECLNDSLVGPVILAFADEDPGATARLMRDFGKEHDQLNVKSLSLGGKALDAQQLEAVANLPTRDQALAQLLSVMQAPIAKFVRTLAEPHAKLVRTLAAVRDKKQSEAA